MNLKDEEQLLAEVMNTIEQPLSALALMNVLERYRFDPHLTPWFGGTPETFSELRWMRNSSLGETVSLWKLNRFFEDDLTIYYLLFQSQYDTHYTARIERTPG